MPIWSTSIFYFPLFSLQFISSSHSRRDIIIIIIISGRIWMEESCYVHTGTQGHIGMQHITHSVYYYNAVSKLSDISHYNHPAMIILHTSLSKTVSADAPCLFFFYISMRNWRWYIQLSCVKFLYTICMYRTALCISRFLQYLGGIDYYYIRFI